MKKLASANIAVLAACVAGAFASSAPAQAATLFCPPLFVTDGDQVICAIANYGAPQQVTIQMRDGRNGALVEDRLTANLGRNRETGVHHNVVPLPPNQNVIAPAHPVVCRITGARRTNMRASFARLAGAAAVDDNRFPIDFEETVAAAGGEMVECR